MALVADFLSKDVHTIGQNDPVPVTNILSQDFVYEWHTGQSGADGNPLPPEVVTIPQGATMHFPKYMAVIFAIEISKRHVYSECKDPRQWKGFHEAVWLPIAEKIVTGGLNTKPTEEAKTANDLLKEQIAAMNPAEVAKTLDELKAEAKAKGIARYWLMSKEKLIAALNG